MDEAKPGYDDTKPMPSLMASMAQLCRIEAERHIREMQEVSAEDVAEYLEDERRSK